MRTIKIYIESDRGRLRLRLRYDDKNRVLALGLPDSKPNRAYAKQLAAKLELDFLAGRFDETLQEYRPKKVGTRSTELSCPELFQTFTQAMSKEKELAPGTLEKYRAVLSHLKRSLNVAAHLVTQPRAGNMAAVLREQLSDRTAKEYLWLLESCWRWAKGKYHVPADNPWRGLAAKIKPSPRQKTKPFTDSEVRVILGALKSDRYYSHYFPMVCFLFGTGARFGEVAALKWKHLSSDFSQSWVGESISRGNLRKKPKTGEAREIVLSPGLVAMLKDLHQKRQPKPNDLIFPAPRGGAMDDQNFRKRAWKTMLDRLGIDYRKPYSTRHTAVSHALANGAEPLQVATQAGHNPQILYKNYASVIQSKSIFVEF